MKEVHCRVFDVLFSALTERGIAHEALVEDLPHQVEFLKNTRNRVDWDEFAEYMERLSKLLGGREALEGIGFTVPETRWAEPYMRLLGLAASAHRLYWLMANGLGQATFGNIKATYSRLADDRIMLVLEIPQSYRECEEFFWVTAGHFRVVPRLLGQTEAYLEAEITPRRAVYTITPPPSLTALARLRRVFRVIGAGKTAMEELRGQQEQLAAGYKELQEALDKLRESEARFRGLFEAAFGGMLIHEAGVILEANETAAEMFGFEMQEVLGKSVLDFVSQESRALVLADLSEESDRSYEITAVKKDGAEVNLEVISKAHRVHGRAARIVGLRDITERKKLEEEIVKAKKIESLGVLAAGIAHDFNNLLAVNLWNLDLAARSEVDGAPVKERLEKAKGAALRAKALTNRLLTFSLGGAPVKSPTSLGRLIKESADFCVCGSNINCGLDLADDLWAAEVDEGQIHQVLSNLVFNAAEAMPAGGAVKVQALNFTKEEGDAGLPLPAGRYVLVMVKDSGCGIPAVILAKIFDPFFTTKDQGSGLGLATAQSIVARHGGHIHVNSKVGKGTTFYVYLPASERPATADQTQEYTDLKGEGRILIVDDEPAITEAVGAGLAAFGYTSESAADGAEALELYENARRQGNPFDAVVTDLTVRGGMGGKNTVVKLLAIDPEAKVIASSGYTNDEVAAEYAKHGFAGFIAKPYDLRELAGMVKVILGAVSKTV